MNFQAIDGKLRRARNQIATLVTDFERLGKTVAHLIVQKEKTERGVQRFVIPTDTANAIVDLSVRTGEVLYNLRSALDHLVEQLVLANGGKPTPKNQFPICDDEGEWPPGRTLEGVSPRHEEAIKSHQPFQASDMERDPLRILRKLSNRDKHRHLNFTIMDVRVTHRYSQGETTGTMPLANELGQNLGWQWELLPEPGGKGKALKEPRTTTAAGNIHFIVDTGKKGTGQAKRARIPVEQQLRECLRKVCTIAHQLRYDRARASEPRRLGQPR